MTERAQIYQTPEQSKVVLGHGYWMGDRKINPTKIATVLALWSHISAKATALAQKEATEIGYSAEVLSPLGNLRGPQRPAEGDLYKEALVRYGVPDRNVIREGDVYSTGGEVAAVVEFAEKRKSNRIIDVAFGEHQKTIRILFERMGGLVGIDFKSAEDILREKDTHKFERVYKVRRVLNVDKEGTPTPWKEVPVQDRQYEETDETRLFSHKDNHTARLMDRILKSLPYKAYKWTYEKPKRFLLKHHLVDLVRLEERQRNARQTSDPEIEWVLPFDQYFLRGKKADPKLALAIILGNIKSRVLKKIKRTA